MKKCFVLIIFLMTCKLQASDLDDSQNQEMAKLFDRFYHLDSDDLKSQEYKSNSKNLKKLLKEGANPFARTGKNQNNFLEKALNLYALKKIKSWEILEILNSMHLDKFKPFISDSLTKQKLTLSMAKVIAFRLGMVSATSTLNQEDNFDAKIVLVSVVQTYSSFEPFLTPRIRRIFLDALQMAAFKYQSGIRLEDAYFLMSVISIWDDISSLEDKYLESILKLVDTYLGYDVEKESKMIDLVQLLNWRVPNSKHPFQYQNIVQRAIYKKNPEPLVLELLRLGVHPKFFKNSPPKLYKSLSAIPFHRNEKLFNSDTRAQVKTWLLTGKRMELPEEIISKIAAAITSDGLFLQYSN